MSLLLDTPTAGDWSFEDWFPEKLGADYQHAMTAYEAGLREALEASRQALTPASLDSWSRLLLRWERLEADGTHLGAYLICLRSADSRDERAASEWARMQTVAVLQRQLEIAVGDAFRTCSEPLFGRLLGRPELRSAGFRLERCRQNAQTMMSAELESLAAELSTDGIKAWGRLYDTVSGALEFEYRETDGSLHRVPMAMKNSLLEHRDPEVRRSAMESSNRAWESVGPTIAACLNGIAGTRLTLQARQHVRDYLEPALFQAAISRRTLDAMMSAVFERREVAREYLRLKARLLGLPRLGCQDLFAPPVLSTQTWTWEAACGLVQRNLGRLYPALGQYAADSFRRRWIDHSSRPGKRQGGFLYSSDVTGQSRIFMTFNGTTGNVGTLVHELGHAFHHHVMRGERPFNMVVPMTLAETASTFAEALMAESVLQSPEVDRDTRLATLAARLDHATAFLLNIPTRYWFERRFHEERRRGEVPMSRLKELMLEAEREWYGDVVDPEQLDPWFWASKLHFYDTDTPFYNFPYTFGYLFSLGVLASLGNEDPQRFERYEQLLTLTGSCTAEEVARRSLGVDLERPDFWMGALDRVAAEVELFRTLV